MIKWTSSHDTTLAAPKFTLSQVHHRYKCSTKQIPIVWCKTDNVHLNKAPNQITMNHFLMFNYGIIQHCFRFIRGLRALVQFLCFCVSLGGGALIYTHHFNAFRCPFFHAYAWFFGDFRFCLIKCVEFSERVFSLLSFVTPVRCYSLLLAVVVAVVVRFNVHCVRTLTLAKQARQTNRQQQRPKRIALAHNYELIIPACNAIVNK